MRVRSTTSLLAENHVADSGLGRGDVSGGRFRRTDDHVFELLDSVSACHRHHALLDFGGFWLIHKQ